MKNLDNKGFGAVEGLLILVIVGIIGGAGYYVYKQNKDNKFQDSSSTQTNSKQKSEIPEGWKEYKNEQLV